MMMAGLDNVLMRNRYLRVDCFKGCDWSIDLNHTFSLVKNEARASQMNEEVACLLQPANIYFVCLISIG